MKFEELPGGFGHLDAKNDARLIRLVRETIGEDRDLMIDVQNAWNDVGQAIATCRAIAPYNVHFLEAPLPADNLEAYRRLAEAVDIRIAVGDWGCGAAQYGALGRHFRNHENCRDGLSERLALHPSLLECH